MALPTRTAVQVACHKAQTNALFEANKFSPKLGQLLYQRASLGMVTFVLTAGQSIETAGEVPPADKHKASLQCLSQHKALKDVQIAASTSASKCIHSLLYYNRLVIETFSSGAANSQAKVHHQNKVIYVRYC